jgi:putative membrane protein
MAWIRPVELVWATAWAQQPPYRWEHPMGMRGAWGFGLGFLMLLFWAAVIVGIVLLIRWLISQGKVAPPDSALEILRQRYARGEIDKEEFEVKKRDLS